ncbi:MAG TPA: GreA/GreB family elongation factor [Burkholderiales bacterium]
MAHDLELIFCNRDAAALARLRSDALSELLMDARLVADDALPEDCVALGSRVTYREEGDAAPRTVTLVTPEAADAAAGRISVLSPIGLALIGRRRGASSEARLPNGRRVALRVLDTAEAAELAGAAA